MLQKAILRYFRFTLSHYQTYDKRRKCGDTEHNCPETGMVFRAKGSLLDIKAKV